MYGQNKLNLMAETENEKGGGRKERGAKKLSGVDREWGDRPWRNLEKWDEWSKYIVLKEPIKKRVNAFYYSIILNYRNPKNQQGHGLKCVHH